MKAESILLRGVLPALVVLASFVIGYVTGGDAPATSSALITRDRPRVGAVSEASSSTVAGEARRKELLVELYQIGGYASRAHRVAGFEAYLGTLSLDDLRLALETLSDLPEHLREDTMKALLARLIVLDAAGTAKLVQASRSLFPSVFFPLWFERDPQAAIAWWKTLRLAGPFPGNSQIGYALVRLAETDPAQAARLLLADDDTLDAHVFRDVFEKWAKADPRAAVAQAMALGNVLERRNAARAAVRGWMENDPVAALAWFRQITDAKLHADLAAGVAIGLLPTDPSQGLEIVRALPAGSARDGELATLAEALFFRKGSREVFLSMVGEVPFDEGNEDVARLIRNWSHNDGVGFLRHFVNRLDSPDVDRDERRAIEGYLDKDSQMYFFGEPSGVLQALTQSAQPPDAARQRWIEQAAKWWGQKEIAPARAWAEGLPAGTARDRAFAGLAAGWAATGFAETAKWLEMLPRSSARDAAVGGFVRGVLGRDPASALEWLRTLPIGEQPRVLQASWQDWRDQDPVAAENWRDGATELTAAERLALPGKPRR